MFDPEIGRFISRDPIVSPKDPMVVMAINKQRNKNFIEHNGYHDGMSLYNAYFAEQFGLDPMGTCHISGNCKLESETACACIYICTETSRKQLPEGGTPCSQVKAPHTWVYTKYQLNICSKTRTSTTWINK